MEINVIELISTLGFPIACAVFLGYFIFHIYNTWTKENQETLKRVQDRCQAREDRLYEEIAKNREINEKAINTIAHYAEKLDVIQKDISDIKTDVVVLMHRE